VAGLPDTTMIRRTSDDAWLLITQTEHARIAAELAAAWGNDRFPPLPLPEWLLPAIRHHDDGWTLWDSSPQIDPETGQPRDFTEMPMAESTAIWTRSIEICSHAIGRPASGSECLKRLGNWLEQQHRSLTRSHEQVLALFLEATEPLSEESLPEMRPEADGDSNAVPDAAALLDDLLQAGVIAPNMPSDATRFTLAEDLLAPSPLGGLWVSGHFCDLASRARENRTSSEDLAAIDHFLDEQAALQAEWRRQLAARMPDDELAPLIELGLRYVQRFDHLSLWLCCAERDKPFELAFPGAGQIHFVPLFDGQVVVDPWPFAADRLELTVAPAPVPPLPCRDDRELHERIADAPAAVLRWVLMSGQ